MRFARVLYEAGLVWNPVYQITAKADVIVMGLLWKIFILGGIFTLILCPILAEGVIIACIVGGLGFIVDGVIMLSVSRKKLLKVLTPPTLLYLE